MSMAKRAINDDAVKERLTKPKTKSNGVASIAKPLKKKTENPIAV